jgi:hypothetical protein
MLIKKVISGGQTGADRLGLEVAKEMGIETGGHAPKNYKTEIGNDNSLKEFGLIEDFSYYYSSRTEKNVKNSNGTVIFGDISSAGSKETIKYITKHRKPYVTNPTPDELNNFINENNVEILNVAGNRASKLNIKQLHSIVDTLRECFKLNRNDNTGS